MSDPTIVKISGRFNGIAGQFQINATVQYEGEAPETLGFVGNVSGGPIVMISPNGSQVFVSQGVTDRIGTELTPAWIRRFFGPR